MSSAWRVGRGRSATSTTAKFRTWNSKQRIGQLPPPPPHHPRFHVRLRHCFSVHWLSQVPREAVDKGSAAYNRGKVFVHGASEATGAAYRRQFQSDLSRFLRRRAAELKLGGVMFLLCLGRPAADPTDQGRVKLLYGTPFEDSWADLVREGLMESGRMDNFNVPLYAPTLDEVREAVAAAGAFRINRLARW
ncbi:Indole-3-acetate O-methyltransferase 1 [Dichanthelium oligosanthes]|uniref:Indole-3-acetate O-methyltransferase 1 n=1 Tax=Dichanthelium oligosanthes TaxID=888268 RepID=A0A1E5VJY5_9POAL|nr:Indole-3-acetate O-methyltransferase 1 [Dichanthelium oligosanthes]